jgi:hypothetical protein
MNKQQLLNKLDKAWVDFQGAYAGLTDAQMLEPGVTELPVRDLLAHVSWWARSLKHSRYPVRKPAALLVLYGGIDAFNALMRSRNAHYHSSKCVWMGLRPLKAGRYINSVPEEKIVPEPLSAPPAPGYVQPLSSMQMIRAWKYLFELGVRWMIIQIYASGTPASRSTTRLLPGSSAFVHRYRRQPPLWSIIQ